MRRVTRIAQKRARHGRIRPLRQVMIAIAAAMARPNARLDGVLPAGNCGRVRGRPVRGCATCGGSTGVPRKTLTSTQRRPHTVAARDAACDAPWLVAELGVGDYRGHRQASRANLPQQRQRVAPLFLKRTDGGIRARCALIWRQPLFGQIQARAEQPRVRTRPERGVIAT